MNTRRGRFRWFLLGLAFAFSPALAAERGEFETSDGKVLVFLDRRDGPGKPPVAAGS